MTEVSIGSMEELAPVERKMLLSRIGENRASEQYQLDKTDILGYDY